jgi:hypothetical protein
MTDLAQFSDEAKASRLIIPLIASLLAMASVIVCMREVLLDAQPLTLLADGTGHPPSKYIAQ